MRELIGNFSGWLFILSLVFIYVWFKERKIIKKAKNNVNWSEWILIDGVIEWIYLNEIREIMRKEKEEGGKSDPLMDKFMDSKGDLLLTLPILEFYDNEFKKDKVYFPGEEFLSQEEMDNKICKKITIKYRYNKKINEYMVMHQETFDQYLKGHKIIKTVLIVLLVLTYVSCSIKMS